jgi:hypothetical protein
VLRCVSMCACVRVRVFGKGCGCWFVCSACDRLYMHSGQKEGRCSCACMSCSCVCVCSGVNVNAGVYVQLVAGSVRNLEREGMCSYLWLRVYKWRATQHSCRQWPM